MASNVLTGRKRLCIGDRQGRQKLRQALWRRKPRAQICPSPARQDRDRDLLAPPLLEAPVAGGVPGARREDGPGDRRGSRRDPEADGGQLIQAPGTLSPPAGTLSPHSMPKSESPPPRAGDPQTLVGRGEIKGSTSGPPAAESARSGRLAAKGAPTLGVYRRGARLGLAER